LRKVSTWNSPSECGSGCVRIFADDPGEFGSSAAPRRHTTTNPDPPDENRNVGKLVGRSNRSPVDLEFTALRSCL
jgi:hypothetical protein